MDYVIESQTGEHHLYGWVTTYFWYIADAEVLYIEDLQREDVIICFGE